VADARELPFPDETFRLIFEKGTMDAMISDAEVGATNCVRIVTECARTLAAGGKLPITCSSCLDRHAESEK